MEFKRLYQFYKIAQVLGDPEKPKSRFLRNPIATGLSGAALGGGAGLGTVALLTQILASAVHKVLPGGNKPPRIGLRDVSEMLRDREVRNKFVLPGLVLGGLSGVGLAAYLKSRDKNKEGSKTKLASPFLPDDLRRFSMVPAAQRREVIQEELKEIINDTERTPPRKPKWRDPLLLGGLLGGTLGAGAGLGLAQARTPFKSILLKAGLGGLGVGATAAGLTRLSQVQRYKKRSAGRAEFLERMRSPGAAEGVVQDALTGAESFR